MGGLNSEVVHLANSAPSSPAALSRGVYFRKEVMDLKGTVKRVIRERGFGFISAEDGREIFFHRSALEGVDFDALEEGNNVEFNEERGPKGPRAVNVRVIKA